jgi:hypothetical protein
MSAILKVKIPFKRRKSNGGVDGVVTFYLDSTPTYLPQPSQTVIITHTDVPPNSGLRTKLNSISTNTVTAIYQDLEVNNTLTSIEQTDGFNVFMLLQYTDTTFSTSQFGGDCRGYIEYDINPSTYTVLKPIESSVIVNESVPFDLNDGINNITNKLTRVTITGDTYVGYPNFMKGMFVKRNDTNTIFANLLKSLNLPVSDEEMKKYTRSAYGTLSVATGTTFDTTIDGTNYVWTPITVSGSTSANLVVHPTNGYTGEYYGTVLQPIGSYEFNKTNYPNLTPITNDVYLIFEIPNGSYGEIIDGKSIEFTLPYYTNTGTTTGIDSKLGYYAYSSTPTELKAYGTYNKKNLSATNLDRVLSEIDLSVKDIGIRPDLATTPAYESNVVLLFSDNIKTPQGSNLSSWESGYSDLIDGVRVFNPTAIEKAPYDYNLDECIGFVALDKGFVVITHPKVVDSYFRNVFGGTISKSATASLANAFKTYDINGTLSTATSRDNVMTDPNRMIVTKNTSDQIIWDSTQFVFTGITGSSSVSSDMQYISYNTEKSLNIVCLASSDEFFKSTNDTAKELTATSVASDFTNFKSDTQNLYPVIVTSLGIHDANGNLLAICKPTQPVKKYWYDVVSFNVKIRL